MPFLPRVRSFGRTLTGGTTLDMELDAELRAHVDLLIDEKIAGGMSPDAARRAALLEVGGVEQVKEHVRDVRIGLWLDTLVRDVLDAWRTLRRTPVVAGAAILSLAIGIGLNTSVFSAVHAVLLQALPFRDPDSLVALSETVKQWEAQPVPAGFSPADYLDLKLAATSFQALASVSPGQCTVRAQGSTRTGACARVSAEFFPMLGVPAARGRYFSVSEDRPGVDVAVLSDASWRQRFGASEDIVGQEVLVDGRPHVIVGVMPPSFRTHNWWTPVDLWVPYPFALNPPQNRRMFTLSVVGRLRPGVTVKQASAEVNGILRAVAARNPSDADRFTTVTGGWARPLADSLAASSRGTLLMCWTSVALVLAVACMNVAGLLLARTESRRRELAIRASLGAGRGRLARQLMIESLLLALIGSLAGVAVTMWAGPWVLRLLPEAEQMARLDEARLSVTVVGFAISLAFITCGVFGLAPAWRGSAVDLRHGLSEGTRTITEARESVRLRSGFFVLQLALTTVLLACAGLMVRSIWNLHRVPLGFDADRVLTIHSQLPTGEPFAHDLGIRPAANAPGQQMHQWTLTERAVRFPDEAVRRIHQIPGVESAAISVMGLPMSHTFWYDFAIDDQQLPAPGEPSPVAGELWKVTASYFDVMGIRLLSGRSFTPADRLGAPRVAIVNRHMARTAWPSIENVVGRRVKTEDGGYEIVGMVEDVRVWPQQEGSNQVYVALAQDLQPVYDQAPASFRLGFDVVVRTSGNPRSFVRPVTEAIARADPAVPTDDVLPYRDVVTKAFGPWRSTVYLFVLNGVVALCLSIIGLYGLIDFSVVQRTREIGVRMALGATAAGVTRLVLGRAIALTAAGMCLGGIGAFWTDRLVGHRLYGVGPGDPGTLVGVATALVLVAVVSAWVPARRAAALDPATTLRSE